MLKMIECCDCCGNPLLAEIVKIPHLNQEIKVVKTSRTKVVNTYNLFPYLCESCALKIDNELLMFKQSVLCQ